MIPDDVHAALASLGLSPVAAEPITGLPTADDRLTLRVVLDGGGAVKVRRCRWEQQARQYQALAAGTPGVWLSRVLARVGRVCVEEWIDGTSLAVLALTESRVEAAGDLLGRLHAVRGLASTSGLARRLVRQLARLSLAGRLERELVERVASRLLHAAPREAPWGVIHFDFCAENLVEGDDGNLVAIDNERLQLGFLDFDVARTWYRWRMPPAQWTAFRAAYARHRPPPSETFTFWCIAAAATSLSLRLRGGAGRIATPLAILEELLGE